MLTSTPIRAAASFYDSQRLVRWWTNSWPAYSPPAADRNGVDLKELSRLISRSRHRQFGILVATSLLGHQAYQELRSDRHPGWCFIDGGVIATILVKAGLGTPEAVREWLTAEFPTG